MGRDKRSDGSIQRQRLARCVRLAAGMLDASAVSEADSPEVLS